MDKAPTYNGKSIFDKRVPLSGIKYSFALEWRLGAQWAGYKFEDFVELPTDQQAQHVAAYRCSQQIQAVVSHEQAKASKARSASRPGPRSRKSH